MEHHISKVRDCVNFAKETGKFINISKAVDPHLEMASIIKAFDGGPQITFDNIKGYPGSKVLANLMGNRDMIAGYFNTTKEKLSERLIRCMLDPINPVVEKNPPCQGNVIDKDIDVLGTLPVLTHTSIDLGPVITSGIIMVKYPEEMAKEAFAFNLSYHRLNPSRGPDWLTLASLYNRHFLDVLHYHKKRGEEYPITINIGLGPGLNVMAAGGTLPQIRTRGLDDLRVAGGLQGEAVRICKARTVDAYCIADAEIVLEGKILYGERVFEYDKEAHTSKNPPYYFPEFMGYEGVAEKAFKFQVTGITYKNSPYYLSQMGDSIESSNLGAIVSEASIYNACKNHAPDSFINCHIPDPMKGILGAVIQCKTNHIMETGISQGLINAAFGAIRNLKMVVAVDEDVNIYDPEDVLWAINLRTKPDRDINIIKKAGLGELFETRWSVDTTVPFTNKWRARRPVYQKINLGDFVEKTDVEKGLSFLSDSARRNTLANIIKPLT
ncbi:UbiD family decarboxylase [Desulfobacula sp.]|uniref:UbiD family decarboxylase n=1 Tax=Desulfobacula sp. TaxID=2593537 RepID=UPI002615C497|nr:UbiD family decarboxylase [Desulfobacula sp.]